MTELDRYKAKLTRLLKHKEEEPNNTYHDWDMEIQRCKNNIAEEVMEEGTGWNPVEKEKPQTYIYDRLWLTIQYPSGTCRTIEGRYNRYEDVFLHVNQKPIKEKVVAWKEYGVPSPFQPAVQ